MIELTRRGAIGAALLSAVSLPAPAQSPTNITFSLDFTALGRHVGWFVALDRGHYRGAGLNVRIVPGQGTGQAVQAVEAGVAQFAFSDVAAVVAARANSGATTKMIAAIYQKAPYCLFSMTGGANIARPEQMAGAQIGTGAGSLTSKVYEAYMADKGLDASTLRFVNIDPTARVGMLVSGRVASIDLFLMSEPGIRKAAGNAGVSTFLLADHGLELYSNGILAKEAYLRANPDVARRFVAASLAGWRDTFADPAAAVESVLRYNRALDRETVAAEIEIVRRLVLTPDTARDGIGSFDAERMSRSVALVGRIAGGANAVRPEDVADTGFLPASPIRL